MLSSPLFRPLIRSNQLLSFMKRQCGRSMASTTNHQDKDPNNNNNNNIHHDITLDPFIPHPTWSVKDLQLERQHPKLPMNEIHRLAHQTLLDIHRLPPTMEQDVANMMHMLQEVVTTVEKQHLELFDKHPCNNDDDDDDVWMYDFVRGVTAAPMRQTMDMEPEADNNHSDDNDTHFDNDDDKYNQQQQAESVWKNYLEPKTIRQGGAHQYFAISTK